MRSCSIWILMETGDGQKRLDFMRSRAQRPVPEP